MSQSSHYLCSNLLLTLAHCGVQYAQVDQFHFSVSQTPLNQASSEDCFNMIYVSVIIIDRSTHVIWNHWLQNAGCDRCAVNTLTLLEFNENIGREGHQHGISLWKKRSTATIHIHSRGSSGLLSWINFEIKFSNSDIVIKFDFHYEYKSKSWPVDLYFLSG